MNKVTIMKSPVALNIRAPWTSAGKNPKRTLDTKRHKRVKSKTQRCEKATNKHKTKYNTTKSRYKTRTETKEKKLGSFLSTQRPLVSQPVHV